MKKLFMVMAITIAVLAQIPTALAAEPQRRTAPLQVETSSSDVKASGQIAVGPAEGQAYVRFQQRSESSSATGASEDPGNLGRGTGKASLDPNGRRQELHETVGFKMRKALDVDDGSPAGIKFPMGKLTLDLTDRKAALLFGKRYITDPAVKQMVENLLQRLGADYSGQSEKNTMVLEVFENSAFQRAFGKTVKDRGADWSKIIEEYAMFVNGLAPDGKELKSEEKTAIWEFFLPSNGEKVTYVEKTIEKEVLPDWVLPLLALAILLYLLLPIILRRNFYKPVGDDLKEAQEDAAKAEQRAEDLAEQLDEKAQEVADAKAALTAAQKTAEESDKENQRLKEEAAGNAEKLAGLTDEVERLTDERDKAQQEAGKNAADNQALREQAAANSETIKNQGDTILALTTARDNAEKKAAEEGRRANAAEKHAENLERENDALKKERDAANKAAGEANAKLEQAQAQAARDADEIRNLSLNLREQSAKVEDLTKQLAEARATINRLERENGEKSEKLNNALERATKIQEELEMTQKELEAAKNALKTAEGALTDAQQEMALKDQRIAQLEKDQKAAEDRHAKELKAAQDQAAKDAEKAKEMADKELKAAKDQATKDAEKAAKDIASLNKRLEVMEISHQGEMSELRATFENMAREQREGHEKAISNLQNNLDSTIKEAQAQAEKDKNALSAANDKAHSAEKALGSLQERFNTLSTESSAQKQRIIALEGNLRTANGKIKRLNNMLLNSTDSSEGLELDETASAAPTADAHASADPAAEGDGSEQA